MGDKDHHVHFSGASGFGTDNNIMIQPQRHGKIDVHLGFLQLHHRYHVEFSIPWSLCTGCKGKRLEPAIVTGTHDPKCHIIDLGLEKNGLRIKVELLAYKEHILKQEVQLTCCKTGSPLKLQLTSRVMTESHGSPLLRNGIHNVGKGNLGGDEVQRPSLRPTTKSRSSSK